MSDSLALEGDAEAMRRLTTRDLPAAYGNVKCEWQECEASAACVRDTPWGELVVCREHGHAPLDGGRQ